MKVTYLDMLGDTSMGAYAALRAVKDMPLAGRLAVTRTLRALEEERKVYAELRAQIVEEYIDIGYERLKKAIPVKAGEELPRPTTVQPEEMVEFTKKEIELLQTTVELSVKPLPISTLGELPGVAPEHLLALQWLLIDDAEQPLPADSGGNNRKARRAIAKKKGK